ncbi:MAG: hypothetical protein ACXWZS_02425 [Gemmatirosa sp.]
MSDASDAALVPPPVSSVTPPSYDRRASAVDATLGAELLKTAYASHFTLCQHYSSVVLQVRIAIMTLVVAAVAMAVGVFPGVGDALPLFDGVTDRSLLAYVAVVLLTLLHAMEVGYMKRYLQVVASGREMEQRAGVSAFFSRYDRTESWPLHLAYALAMLVLMGVFVGAAWKASDPAWHQGVVAVLAAAPFALYVVSNVRRRDIARALLDDPARRTT